MIKHDNFIIVISAPSGAGKSTLVRKLLEEDKNLNLSISATTRKPRGEEKDGIDYNFLTKEEFENKIKSNDFLEYAQVFDNYYGTLKSEVEKKWNNNIDVVLDIDYQGAENIIKKIDHKRLLTIFILPPSLKELKNRLITRNENTIEEIEKRLNKAKLEISHCYNYDFVVINDDLESAFNEIKSLILTKRKENINKEALKNFIENL